MQVFVIGSAPAVWGFALAGVRGRIVQDVDELTAALDEVLQAEDLGVVLITEDVAAFDHDRIEHLMARGDQPLIVEIPGPEGPIPGHPSIGELMRRTIGVRV